ncbi:MAG: hypothetical protein QG615_1059 [Nitrospirota bacterium]|nr:hypothetical protein [Nitrospirota bacterium]
MTMMDTIVREGKTERRIRALDAGDIVQEIHGLEDERDSLAARLAEAVECCTIKDNRNLRLEAKVADLERQLHWALTGDMPTDSASAVQPERCCLDYPRCDCNSPPEPAQEPKGCNHFPGQVNCEWCTEVPHE